MASSSATLRAAADPSRKAAWIEPERLRSCRASWSRSSCSRMTVARVATRTEFSFGIVVRISSMASCSMTSGSSATDKKNPVHALNNLLILANMMSTSLFFRRAARSNRVFRNEVPDSFGDLLLFLNLHRAPRQELLLLGSHRFCVLFHSRSKLGQLAVDLLFERPILPLFFCAQRLEMFRQYPFIS